jgi:hypothetical protein
MPIFRASINYYYKSEFIAFTALSMLIMSILRIKAKIQSKKIILRANVCLLYDLAKRKSSIFL